MSVASVLGAAGAVTVTAVARPVVLAVLGAGGAMALVVAALIRW